MPELQFDHRLTSNDGKMYLFIRGPFNVEDGVVFELKMVPIVAMKDWPGIRKE